MKGYFNDEKREYVIEDMYPRRPLMNYLWNNDSVCSTDQFGHGGFWSLIDNKRRYIDGGERNVYIKDRTTGEFYSANRNYTHLPFDTYQCHVGIGYQKIVSEYEGIRAEFTLLVPTEGYALLHRVRVENISGKEKQLDVYFQNRPKPDLSGHFAYGYADYDEETGGLYYPHVGDRMSVEYQTLYLTTEKPFFAYEVAPQRFCGVYNTLEKPLGLMKDSLSSTGTTFEADYYGAFQYRLTLQAGEAWDTVIALGTARNKEECKTLGERYASGEVFEEELAKQVAIGSSALDTFSVNSTDSVLNSQTNIWLKRQLTLGKDWGRLYGKGFRDVMQDVSAFLSLDPAFARERILYMLKHLYEDGNPIRMIEPNYYWPYNDGAAWIPATVLLYLKESGDMSILDEQLTYIKGDTAANTSYTKPIAYVEIERTEETTTAFEHVKRAMDYLWSSRGKRGLVLFLGGDWNDSLNSVGCQGKGEGVWLTIATVKAHNEFIEILEAYGRTDLIAEYAARRDELKANIMKYGVDGDHLLYGFNDYDEKIGSDENAEAKIYLNPQSWAVLANLADKKTLEGFMDTVEKRLACPFGYVQNAPAYTKGSETLGRSSYFQPGLIENAAVYNHGVSFKVVADCMLGRGDIAYSTLKKIRFDNPDNPNNGMEPYAVSNMFVGPENDYIAGYAPMSWITGTAGWLYRATTEYLCGVRAEFNGLRVSPCFPSSWNALRAVRRFRGATYEIEYVRGTEYKLVVDGEELVGEIVPLAPAGTTKKVKVYFV